MFLNKSLAFSQADAGPRCTGYFFSRFGEREGEDSEYFARYHHYHYFGYFFFLHVNLPIF